MIRSGNPFASAERLRQQQMYFFNPSFPCRETQSPLNPFSFSFSSFSSISLRYFLPNRDSFSMVSAIILVKLACGFPLAFQNRLDCRPKGRLKQTINEPLFSVQSAYFYSIAKITNISTSPQLFRLYIFSHLF